MMGCIIIDTFNWIDWTAVATVIMAVFTGLLWYSTKKLWETTAQSVEVAKEAADAAKKSADSLPTIEKAYVYVRIEENQDITTNHSIFNDFTMHIIFYIFNYGHTPAIIDEIFIFTDPNTVDIPEETNLNIRDAQVVSGFVISSEKDISPHLDIRIVGKEWRSIQNGEKQLHCWGRIRYRDIFKNVRETGFDWQWDTELKSFIASNNEKLNYNK